MPSIPVAQALALPPDERGAALLALIEDQWFERKGPNIQPQTLAISEVALGNADGGTIVVGLSKDSVEGTDRYLTRRNALVQAAIDFTVPPVHARWELVPCINDVGKPDHLLVIEVEPSETVHANQRDDVYLRVGDESRKLTFRLRQELIYDKGQSLFEANLVPRSSLDDLDNEILASFAQGLAHPDPHRLLRARSLVSTTGELTAAGYLLFGRSPQIHFPEAYVRVLKFRGLERGTGSRQQLVHDRRFEGPIPSILVNAAKEVRSLQPARKALGPQGRFERKGLIPEDAWLEGLVNAVVHRSYSLGGDHIRVEIFDDRIEIESPGRFPGLVDPVDLYNATRFARNPRIARVCADLDFGQELGEGIRRMFQEMRIAGLADPLYRQTTASVRLTLLATPIDRELESRLPSHSRDFVALLREAGKLRTGDLVDATAMSRPAVIRRLNALRDAGLVEWIGSGPSDPHAYWKLTP